MAYITYSRMTSNAWYLYTVHSLAFYQPPRNIPYSNTYCTIDDVEVTADSIALELNLAYKAAEDGPALSHNLGTEAVTFETLRDGRGVDEGIERAEGREDEEENVTYYTPMDANEDEGVHSRAESGRNTAENEGDFNWGATTIDEACGGSGRERLVGEDGERDSDEEDSTYTAYTCNVLLSTQLFTLESNC